MSHYLIELYAPKQSWLALAANDRAKYFEAVNAGMADIASAGIEIVAMGELDPAVAHAAPERYFAVWRLPNRELVETLVAAIAASGWHQWFDTVTAAGQGVDFGTHVAQLNRVV